MPAVLTASLFNLLVMVAGFLALIKGADWLVSGAGSFARRWGVSSLAIGLTIVAFGTSAPEFFVNIVSSVKGSSGITLGNVIGSNLANLLLGIGIIAIMRPIVVKHSTAWKEIPFLILASFLLWSSASDYLLDDTATSLISRSEAIMLLGFFLLFMVYTFGISKVTDDHESDPEIPEYSTGKSLGLFFGGLAALALGGEIVVRTATEIALNFGLSETLIGVTIVAVGTSIPDILTTIVAARKKSLGIAVGNIIGSNIFNILWVLGISALIRPIPIDRAIQPDLLFVLGTVLLFFLFQLIHIRKFKPKSLSEVFIFGRGKYEIDRWEGGIFVALYLGYIVLLVLRG